MEQLVQPFKIIAFQGLVQGKSIILLDDWGLGNISSFAAIFIDSVSFAYPYSKDGDA